MRVCVRGSLWTCLAFIVTVAVGVGTSRSQVPGQTEPVDLGTRRELFVDRLLVAQLEGDIDLVQQRPVSREVVLVTDAPWEGNICAYYTILRDGDILRMYYRGAHYDEASGQVSHAEVACYAESRDGIHWTKPELNLFEFEGSKANNIVWRGVGTHNFTPFLDTRPDCPPESRFKALGRGGGEYPHGLNAFQSPDGIHWSLMQDDPVITRGAFDSQNLAFWDAHAGIYREFHRQGRNGLRDIMTGTSADFLQWTDPEFLDYTGVEPEHLYTNAILPYPRAPHLLLGFPTRFHPDRGAQVEPTLMASRDGRRFHRWPDALIPVTAPEDRDGNRSNYMAWGLLELPDRPGELSQYASEAYYTGPSSRLRRFTWRPDGFVALRGGTRGGELITPLVTFEGSNLYLNLKTGQTGMVQVTVELPATGSRAARTLVSTPLRGDHLDGRVSWVDDGELAALMGKPARLRIRVEDGDVYALRFGD